MADGHTLINRYQRYKAGTARFVDWLTTTASRLGKLTNVLPGVANASQPPNSEPEICVTTRQLFQLAQVVTDASVEVPTRILRTLKAVIADRETSADFYTSLNDSIGFDHQQRNDRHRHFIGLLKDIEALLRSCNTEGLRENHQEATNAEEEGSSSEAELLSNIFSGLAIEEPAEQSLGEELQPSSRQHSQDNSANFVLEDDQDPIYFALWCFFQDVQKLREAISKLWLDYKRGHLAFAAAAQISVVGVALLEEAAFELGNEHPVLATCDQIYTVLGLSFTSIDDEVFMYPNNVSKPDNSKPQHNEGDWDPGLLCPRAWVLLLAFKNAAVRRKQGCEGSEDTEGFGVHPLGRHLKDVLATCQPFEKAKLLASDPFLDGLHELAKNTEIPPPLGVLAACQISMDVHDIVGPTPEPEMDHYHQLYERAILSLDQVQQGLEREKGMTASPPFRQGLSRNRETLRDRAKDHYAKHPEPSYGSLCNPGSNFRVHRMLPMFTGSLMLTCMVTVHRTGITYGNGASIVLNAAYLYRSAQLAGVLTQEWADMDLVVRMQSRKRPFILESSQGISSMAPCFGMGLGMKPSSFANKRRPPVADIIYVQKNARSLEPWELPGVLNRDVKSNLIASCVDALARLENRSIFEIQAILKQYRKTGKLSPAQLLVGAREAFTAGSEVLEFDLIGFSMACHRILKKVDSAGGPSLDSLVRKVQQRKPEYLHEVVYALLVDAADHTCDGGTNDSRHMSTAGAVLATFIEQEGASCSKRNTYKTNVFGPELPPNWKAEDEQERILRSFVGLPASAKDRRGAICASWNEATFCTELYYCYRRWKRGDGTMPHRRVREALTKVVGVRLQMNLGEGSRLEMESKITLEVDNLALKFGMSMEKR